MRKSHWLAVIFCILGMLALILDSRCAAQSVQDAIYLCLSTIIPSLFPMLVLTGILINLPAPASFALLSEFCGLPTGSETIFLLGLVGGFPAGAQCIAQAVQQRSLSRQDAQRMLGICNNCGPAFLFGVLGSIFQNIRIPAALLLIQAEAAILTAHLWPGNSAEVITTSAKHISIPDAVSRAVRSMVSICAWVILARVILGFLQRWLFPFLPTAIQILLCGLLELTNGCLALTGIGLESQRFLLCCGFISFGGISVLLQIQAIASDAGLSIDICVRQKLLQALIAASLGCLYLAADFLPLIAILPTVFVLKKAVEKSRILMYNSPSKGGI